MKSIVFIACACALIAIAIAVPIKMHEVEPAALTDTMINHVNSKQREWVAGHNKHFEGKTIQWVKGLLGARKGFRLPEKEITPLSAIPDSFDSRTAWPMCDSIKLVRDQGSCGSCWAFGAAEAMSDRICIASKGASQVEISAEDLVSCCTSCGDGCDGGFPGSAWDYWVHTGLVSGGLYNDTNSCQPYSIQPCNHHDQGQYQPCGDIVATPKCHKYCVDGYNVTFTADKHFGASSYSVGSSVSKIQTEIMTHGPVEAAFTVYSDFPTYKSGVYSHTSGSELGGHAVKIIGWGVSSNTPYWIVANSWNEDWGLQGMFWIKRGNDECGIESSIVAGLPK
jgi:cathepsin B